MKKNVFLLILLLANNLLRSQTPVISSFTPASAKPGDVVTLTGANFSSVAANNVVFFGATRATVTAASSNSVTAIVPIGSTYAPITLLNTETTLSCASLSNFNPVYSPIKNGFTTSDLDPAIVFPVTSVSNLTSNTANNTIAVSDLDGDGKPDVVVANHLENTVSVLRNTATTGTISNTSFGPKINFATNSTPIRVAIGDIDGDGKPDLLVINQSSNNISIFRNTSSGIGNISFDTKIDIATNSNPWGITISDLDGDGKPDLAVICSFISSNLSIFRNTSNGIGTISFDSSIDFPLSGSARSITNGDMDGDGKPDLSVLIGASSYKVSIFRNSSTGAGMISFDPTVDFSTSTSNPYFIAIGDLDGDGKPELAIANSFSASVFRNTSTGAGNISYAPKIDFATGASGGRSIAIGDLDGDGKPDLVVPSVVSSVNSSLFHNSSTGIGDINFTRSNFVTIKNPFAVAIADIDGDNKPDLVTANINGTGTIATGITSETTVSVLRNADPPNPTNPTITSFTPSSGCPNSSTVVIKGTNFTGATAVSIGGTAVNSFTVNSSTQITATVGNGTSGTIAITTPSGTGTSNETFTVNNCNPTIISFTPSSGCANGSTVVITGTNFTGATAVSISGTPVSSFTVNSSSQITAIVGNGTTGAISVTTPGGTATSGDAFIINAAPVFTTCSQNLSKPADAGACSTQLNYTVTATGNPAPILSYVFTGATSGNGSGTGSGASFNLGITNVTITATNSCGSSTCSFTITVTDNTPPTIICPSNITLSACVSTASWTTPAMTDNCPGGTVVQTAGPASGSTFDNGSSTVITYTATDAANNSTSCSFTVSRATTLSASSSATAILCNGGSSTVTVTASGGTAPYSGTGTFTTTAGSYSYIVTDANNCTATTTGTIGQPAALVATCSNNNSSLYFGYPGDQSATIKAIATGGVAPYTVSITMNRALNCNVITSTGDELWSGVGGTSVNNVCPATGPGLIPVSTITGLASGVEYSVNVTLMQNATFTATITDANGCITTCTTSVHAEDVRCFAGNSGNAKVKLCHQTGSATNPCVAICVDQSAVATHLSHGDFLGDCTPNCVAPVYNRGVVINTEPVSTGVFNVRAIPNPTESYFTLDVETASNDKIVVVVYDEVGRLLKYIEKSDRKLISFGEDFTQGTYFAIVIQGKNRKVVKLLKMY